MVLPQCLLRRCKKIIDIINNARKNTKIFCLGKRVHAPCRMAKMPSRRSCLISGYQDKLIGRKNASRGYALLSQDKRISRRGQAVQARGAKTAGKKNAAIKAAFEEGYNSKVSIRDRISRIGSILAANDKCWNVADCRVTDCRSAKARFLSMNLTGG
jgi:hypothetical protein